MKVVINKVHGGFGLSKKAMLRYAKLKGIKLTILEGEFFYTYLTKEGRELYDRNIPRDDPALVQTVEELGSKADGHFAKLKVVKIPDDVVWYVEEYDGVEWIAEKHRTWS
jgi:hypothetical protein